MNTPFQCAICLETDASILGGATKTDCGHDFHLECLQKWEATGQNKTCPVCRAKPKKKLVIKKKETKPSKPFEPTKNNRQCKKGEREENPHNKLKKLMADYNDLEFGQELDKKFGGGKKKASKAYIHNLLKNDEKYGLGEIMDHEEHPLFMEEIMGYIAFHEELVAQEKILWVDDYGAGKGHFEYITLEELESKKFAKSGGLGNLSPDYGIWAPVWDLNPMRVVKYQLMIEELYNAEEIARLEEDEE